MNFECRHYKPGSFRVHHEAADGHICLQFLGSVFVHLCMCHGLVKWHWGSVQTFEQKLQVGWLQICVHSGCMFFVNASHDKDCTTYPRWNGDGVGECAASVFNWQTWASSWCGASAWEADARPTCPCAIQWPHLCRSVVLRNWCGSTCHPTCLILVIGLFSVTFQWHMAQSPFRFF